MRRRDLIVSVAAAAALAACQRQQEAAETSEGASERAIADPAVVVRQLYDPYLTQGATFPAFRDQAPWSAAAWAELETMSARSAARNEPILDFDPLIGAQDHQLANLVVTTDAVVENSHATVRAGFTNLGRPEEVIYDLVWEGDRWRVDNIRGASWDLRQIAAKP